MATKTVSIEEICRILAGEGHEPLTKQAITNFVGDGMPKAARGSYDPQVCTYWYLGRLRTSVKRKETETVDGKTLSLDKEQTRLTAAKADNEEMTAAERRGTLLPLDVHESQMAKLAQIVKLKFLNLPSRLAPKLESLTRNEIKALLSAAVKDTLLELSRYSDVPSSPSPAATSNAAPKRARARARSKPRKRKR